MFKVFVVMSIGLFLSAQGFAGHTNLHVKCTDSSETSFFKMIQQVNKATKERKLEVTFRTAKGGEFEIGDRVAFFVNGVLAGKAKLRNNRRNPNQLIGKRKFPITTETLGFTIRRGIVAEMAGLVCTFRK